MTIRNSRLKVEAESRRRGRQFVKQVRLTMERAEKRAEKQSAKSAPNKTATVNVPPRQVKRTPPVTPSAQTSAKPPAPKPPAVAQPKPLAKLMSTTALDGFSGFNEEVEGDDRQQGGSMIQGTMLKFTSEAEWVTGNGDPMSRECELIVIDLVRAVEKWIDQKMVEKLLVPPGTKFPNIRAMNDAAPRSEWREDLNGVLVGPWQMRYFVYLLDAHTLDKFTWPTGTIGGGMCCREIAEKTTWMRKYRGPKVSAVITLDDTFMKTRFGGRQRPHFNVVRWIGFDGGDALPAPKPALEGGGAAAKPEAPPWNEVEQPSLREELNDDLPDSLK
jgi:hypothetical protein